MTAGCEAALAEALAWLEREACFVRRGTNNRRAGTRPGRVRHPPDGRRGLRRRAVPASHVAARRPAPALARARRQHRPRDRRPLDGARRHRPVRVTPHRRGDVPGGDAPRAERPARRRVGSDAQRLGRDRRHPHPGAARVLPPPRADRRVARAHRASGSAGRDGGAARDPHQQAAPRRHPRRSKPSGGPEPRTSAGAQRPSSSSSRRPATPTVDGRAVGHPRDGRGEAVDRARRRER